MKEQLNDSAQNTVAGTYKMVMLKTNDKVAVALSNIPSGTHLIVKCLHLDIAVELKEAIEFGHKFAVVDIASGEDILKYGEVIGFATRDIAQGEHVHVHNLAGKRGRGDKIDHAK